MKFKFRHKYVKKQHTSAKRRFVLKGVGTLRKFKYNQLAENYEAEGFGVFEDEKRTKFFYKLKHRLKEIIKKRKEKRQAKLCRPPRVSPITLLGILSGVLTVSLISALIVTSSIFFKYNRDYTSVTVPNLLSLSAEEAMAISPDIFEYTVVYKSNPSKPANTVTAQSPLPNVERKFYGTDEKIKLTLTVNSESPIFSLPQLEGTPLREALIMLRSKGINPHIIKEYSDVCEAGQIFYCSLPEGTQLKSGAELTLKASLGREKLYYAVPLLIGKSEDAAVKLIKASGFSVGDILYVASNLPSGTVIGQDTEEGELLLEQSKISLTVSGGIYYQ